MAIVNGYATLDQFKALKRVNSVDSGDDITIENLITRASRLIDTITGKWFYGATQTRYFDYTSSRCLKLDAPLLSVTTFTNGDGSTIAAADYNLLPLNWPGKKEIEIKQSSTAYFLPSNTGDTRGVISIAGSWGYVNRAAATPTPDEYTIIYNTEYACLEIVYMWYEERFGSNVSGAVQVTAAGVVVTPFGKIPNTAYQAIAPYISVL